MHVTGFFGSGLAREDCGERRLALAKAVERGDDVVEGFEAIHALGAAAKFAGSLRAAKQEDAENGDLAAIEVENFLKAMLVFGDAAIGAAGGSGEAFLLKGRERIAYGIVIESHDRLTVIFLVAGIHQSVQRQGIVIGSGDVFLDQRAKNADFDFI